MIKISGLNTIQTIAWQVVVLVVLAMMFYSDNKVHWLSALAWGGMCSTLNVLIISWRASQKVRSIDAARQLRIMYRSVLERVFIVIGLISFGLIKLHLAPLAVFLGFVSCQFVYVLASVLIKVTPND